MTETSARAICDSIGEHSPRLLTIRATNPKFIHQETLRHRIIYIEDALRGDFDFSFSVSSARAIPFRLLLDEVKDDDRRAKPVKWGAEQKGMSPDPADVEDAIQAEAEQIWKDAALDAARHATRMATLRRHKSICNRIIEPYIHVHCLMTAVAPGWLNFFGLRLDKAADPTLQALAEAMWRAWNESTPQKLKPGQWHLPFVDPDEEEIMRFVENMGRSGDLPDDAEERLRIRVSVARCARLSYMSFDTGKRSTIEEDLGLYDRLVGSHPIHASPAEHQATPDRWMTGHAVPVSMDENGSFMFEGKPGFWAHPELSGNLGPGWIQYRKTLPGEAVAPLPEGYA
jgi:thymidylate synthase ThyX